MDGSAHDSAPFWAVPVDDLLANLGTRAGGLDAIAARDRLAASGPRREPRRRDGGATGLLLAQFRSPLVLLLLFAMVLSLVLGETSDALIVFAIVLGSAGLGFRQEWTASNAVARLLARIRSRATVVRDGREVETDPDEVVPGDVLVLAAGAAVPADARILASNDLFVDESALTGESFPAEKAAGEAPADAPLARRTNALFQGSHVVSGTARAVVARTGDDTEFGAISRRLRLRPPETDFERGLRRFGEMLVQLTTLLVLAIFAINVWLERPPVQSILFALALAVGLTPELLPAIVSITLARGAQRMAADHVIVRRLNAIENFGSMDVLCSDKTGTLTEGVARLDAALDTAGGPSERVRLVAVLNAAFETGFRNPIDDSLRREDVPGREAFRKVDEVPWDFVRKRLSVVVARIDDGGAANGRETHLMITKGALRNVLDACDDVEWPGGNRELADAPSPAREPALPHCPDPDPAGPTRRVPLAEVRTALEQRFAEMSADGHRVLGVATRDVTGDPVIDRDDERGMTFVGFLLFEDPPKAGAAEAIDELKRLGVALKLITGDNRLVAARLGHRMGLAASDVLTGEEMRRLGDAALRQRAGRTDVFAEIEPNQKERILLALRASGHVVGFLGDGINDASALHAADVGISVDGAIDVAREAADIVLLRHDLGVLAAGVRLGRETLANTLKYVHITTSANFGNMLSMAVASIFLPFLPLLPKQILLNNFLSDFPSMTIATDAVDPEMVDRPGRWDVDRIRRFMAVFGLVSSIFDLATFAILLLILRADEATFQTSWFVESLLTELFIVLVIRTNRPFWRSRPGWLLLASTIAVVAATLLLPGSRPGRAFGLVALEPTTIGLLLAVTGAYLLASEAAKRMFHRWSTHAATGC